VTSTDRAAHVSTLGEQLPRFARLVHALKAAQTAEGRDRAALVLLYPLTRLGPLRQGALAELMHSDPSTVSRHVASLVEQGLVRREADETDGRASRLVVTDAGHAVLDQFRRERESWLERATTSWSATDLATLTTLFDRLLDDLTSGLPGFGDCAPEPPAPRNPVRQNGAPRRPRTQTH
jgi:DNA-binding MarR family transcriptional regulator